MINRFFIISMCFFCMSTLLWSKEKKSQSPPKEVIRVAFDTWEPYTMEGADGNQGYVNDIIKIIFEKAGYKVEFKKLAFARAVDVFATSGVEMLAGIYEMHVEKTPHYLSPVLGKSEQVLVLLKDDKWEYKGIKSLEDRLILTPNIGLEWLDKEEVKPPEIQIIDSYFWFIGDALRKKNPNIILVSGDDMITRELKMLVSKRGNILAEDINTIKYIASKNDWSDKIRYVGENGKIFSSIHVALAKVHPNSKKWSDLFVSELKELRKSGKLKEILAKYKMTDWETDK